MRRESSAYRMLKFTHAQFDFLDRRAAATFERRLVRRLQEALPASERPHVEAQAGEGIEQAASYGIDTEEEVLQFLWLRHRFGPGFPAEPWAQPLHSAEPNARVRLEATAALLRRWAAER